MCPDAKRRPGRPGPPPGAKPLLVRSATGGRLAESRERVEVSHQRVTTDVGRGSLGRLGGRVRGGAHEPLNVGLVLRVIEAIGAEGGVTLRIREWVSPLLEGVGADR